MCLNCLVRDLPDMQTPYCLRLRNQKQNHQHKSEPSVMRTLYVQIVKKEILQSKNHGNRKLHNSCNYVQKYPTTESQSVKLLTDDDSENYHILCLVASASLIYYPNKTSCTVWRHELLVILIISTRSWMF